MMYFKTNDGGYGSEPDDSLFWWLVYLSPDGKTLKSEHRHRTMLVSQEEYEYVTRDIVFPEEREEFVQLCRV